MANRRMFSRTVIESDPFLSLPATAQALYFHLSMEADDDGFCGCPMRTAKAVGCRKRDLDSLIQAGFLIDFSGVVLIKHWLVNNFVREDRRKPTEYLDLLKKVKTKGNREYSVGPAEDCKDCGKGANYSELKPTSFSPQFGHGLDGFFDEPTAKRQPNDSQMATK